MEKNKGKHYKKTAPVQNPNGGNQRMASGRATVKKKKSKMKTWKKVLIIIIVVILAFAAVAFGYMYSKLGKLDREILDKDELSCVDVDGYVNILMLGVDARVMTSLKDCRTDAIIIASIEEKTGKIHLTSIYRDTYLKMGGDDLFDKVTHAFTHGGAKNSIKTINQALDLNIDKYVVFNFKTVADTVDYLGGINVDVKPYEINELNKYTIQSAKIIGQKDYNLVEQAGKQKLCGPQAVSYGRIRKGVGDDFKRTERMRVVISKCMNKVKKLSFSKIDGLIDLIMPQIKTNMSNGDILYLAKHMTKYEMVGSTGFPYKVECGMINGVSYVFPVDLEKDVIKLHKDVFKQDDYFPSAQCRRISDRIKGVVGGGLTPAPDIAPPPKELTPQEEPQKRTEETRSENSSQTPSQGQIDDQTHTGSQTEQDQTGDQVQAGDQTQTPSQGQTDDQTQAGNQDQATGQSEAAQ